MAFVRFVSIAFWAFLFKTSSSIISASMPSSALRGCSPDMSISFSKLFMSSCVVVVGCVCGMSGAVGAEVGGEDEDVAEGGGPDGEAP